MPIKRRLAKRKVGIPAEAWAMMFRSGYDYLRELADYGIPDDTAAQEAARDAWETHGVAFMAQWTPEPHRALPWAAEAFGLLKGSANARQET